MSEMRTKNAKIPSPAKPYRRFFEGRTGDFGKFFDFFKKVLD